jgi:aldose 1-epimerase
VSRPPLAPASPGRRRVEVRPFGTLQDGRRVDVYELTAPTGMSAQVTSYGGILTTLRVPDRDGRLDDVVLGYDRLEDYVRDPFCLGALIGRYANRIHEGRFRLGDRRVSLETNERRHHLHGGSQGFHKVLWTARPVDRDGGVGVELRHHSPDGHAGYPGNLEVTVMYTLTDEGELVIEYEAGSDQDTIVNLTHHSYFNLGGSVLDHEIVLRARRFTPVDADRIPTGELRDVSGTPFDFTAPTRIGARIDDDDDQLVSAGGYDHNWVLDVAASEAPVPVALLASPASGRLLEVSTTEPGVQLYTGNSLAPNTVGKSGARYGPRSGVCLETQHFPDSPNKPHFPSVTLRAGERYRSTTVYGFATLTPSVWPGASADAGGALDGG